MKKVTKIDKVQNVTNKKQKLRVAAYCRVSTSNDAQLESLETQKAHYESYITSRDDWQFAGLYFLIRVSLVPKRINVQSLCA